MNIQEIYNEYKNGVSLKALSKKLHKDYYTLRNLFLENGLPLKTRSEANRKYKINENFFDKIDTEEKAYFLGFLYADGYNNTERNSVNLSLTENDKDILVILNNLVQPDKPLQFVNLDCNRVNSINAKDQYRLVIANKHISERLVSLGCDKGKTFTLTFPNSDTIPTDLINHFVRGYFDGDGGVYKYKVGTYKKVNLSITSTKEFLTELQNILKYELNFGIVKLITRHPDRENNIRSLHYSGRLKCRAFGEWLYTNATIFLNRKKLVFDSL